MITRVTRTDSHETAAYPRLRRGHAVPAALPGSDESPRAKPASPGFGRSVAYDGLVAVREGLGGVRDGLHGVRDGLGDVRDGLGDVRDGLHGVRDGLVVIAAAYVTVGLFRAVADFMRRRRDD